MNHDLRLALCRSITARAHLAGAEAAELEAQAGAMSRAGTHFLASVISRRAQLARRRYWREQAACELLMGHKWPAAEALGVEP
jgi:hypothetical protein